MNDLIKKINKDAHLKRWITGLALLPALVFCIYDELFFAILAIIACIISLFEYVNIAYNQNQNDQIINKFIFVISAVFGVPIIWMAYKQEFELIIFLVFINFILITLFSFLQFKFNQNIIDDVAKQIKGLIYVPVFMSFDVLIRMSENGLIWTFFLLVVVFVGDISALYVGTLFGKHKLCEWISPNKTIEGSIGGLLGNILVGIIFYFFIIDDITILDSLLFCVLIGICGQIGDLFESELKRRANIKDSGTLLPGHGGMLDRIDALLFAAPLAYFLKEYFL